MAQFFGSNDWVHGKLLDPEHGETEIGRLARESSIGHAGPVVVGIRSEDARVVESSTECENRIQGKVLSSAFLGDQIIAEVKINNTTLMVKSMPDDQKQTGKIEGSSD